MNWKPANLRALAPLLLIAALALWLRLAALDQESAWCDEALTAACLPAASLGEYLDKAFDHDPAIRLAPLYHLVQFSWSRLVDEDLVSLRHLSLTLSMIALIQLYFLARSLCGTSAARWAVFLQAFSLFHIYYAQEVRVYTLLNVLGLFSMQAFCYYWRTGRTSGIAWASAANALLLMTHSFGMLLAVPQSLLMLARWRERAPLFQWIGAHLAIVVAFLLWLRLIGYNVGSESLAFMDRLAGLRELAAFASQFAGGRFTNVNPGEYLAGGLNAELPILAISVALVVWLLARTLLRRAGGQANHQIEPSTLAILVLWLVVPVALLYLAGQVWRPCFYTRYVIYCAAPLSMLVGTAIAGIQPTYLRRGMGALLVLLFLWQNLALPRPFRADYQALTRIVAHSDAPDKVLLALKPFNYRAAAYALRDTAVQVEELFGLKETIGIARERMSQGRSVWVVFYKWDDLITFESAMNESGFVFQRVVTAGMPPAHIYQVRPASP